MKIQWKSIISLYILSLIISNLSIFSQKKIDQETIVNNLKTHIDFLASDDLEGRATASEGENKAAAYIIKYFKKIGLTSLNTSNTPYLQDFTFTVGKTYQGKNKLVINRQKLVLDKDYFPLVQSSNTKVKAKLVDVAYGIQATDIKHDDYAGKKKADLAGKVFLIDIASPKGMNPHTAFAPYLSLSKKIETAKKMGAIGVVFINKSKDVEDLTPEFKKKISSNTIPVVYVKKAALKRLKLDGKRKAKAKVIVNLAKIQKTGKNVLGFIDNGAETTVVIGGHYDHLGYGESGGSLHAGEAAIHNGADDNASGIAAIIELADFFKQSKSPKHKKHNYLFIAFSGEEMGLIGSNHYVNNPLLPIEKTTYMLNYDMVGRLDSSNQTLLINGVGTSPAWEIMDKIEIDGIKIKTTASGVGASDHSSFYWKKIPAVHFFTGAHEDYHKPSDDAHLINYEGLYNILRYSVALVDGLSNQTKLAFTTTKEDNTRSASKFSVTLGVMPSYAYDGKGLKITGVIEDRPAKKAGLQENDIIIKMGDVVINDIYDYMDALSQFKKSETTNIVVKRKDEEKTFKVQF